MRCSIGLATLAVAACSIVRGAPTDGHYDGELCVATNANPPSCGPAEVSLARGQARVQVSDIVYRLTLRDRRLELVLMHGTMQIDGFDAPFTWQDRVLRFQDPDKPVVYRIRFADHTARPG
ncbi:MAG: hypothetical protein ABIO45_11380 [Burkholderiaceae bacterium]